jgi:hypothetical protein
MFGRRIWFTLDRWRCSLARNYKKYCVACENPSSLYQKYYLRRDFLVALSFLNLAPAHTGSFAKEAIVDLRYEKKPII